jgi:predicted histone-like DNA-binding protein
MDMQVVKTKMGVGPKKGQIQYTLKRVSYADVTSEALLDEIKSASTFSPADAKSMLGNFVDVVKEDLLEGRIVDLGVLGSLMPKISVKSVDTRKECDLSTIKSVGIQYTPATELTSDAKKISMQVIDIYDYEDETEGDETEGDDNTGNDNQGGGDSGGGGGFAG